ncbi:PREDICTED: uncharacterized protein LOC108549320 isoform X1 [Eufriesea mexicana]|uniref:uncharacterized protein LOC108549320 isoform X1 n=1 Tax=Eufriesea mexicana TaxID=516756 RepID=UPI00083BC9FB|nr:PREDICTED: uncharacterized protein LOC108549320 isoform X1 [Eufriesea mexicana]
MVGWLDGGAPSAQAAPSDADAVTGAQRDPMQLDERRISGAGSNVEAWASGNVRSSDPLERRSDERIGGVRVKGKIGRSERKAKEEVKGRTRRRRQTALSHRSGRKRARMLCVSVP